MESYTLRGGNRETLSTGTSTAAGTPTRRGGVGAQRQLIVLDYKADKKNSYAEFTPPKHKTKNE